MKEKKGYFEGWYFKQEKGKQAVAFIPAFHRDREGRWSASVQAVTGDGAFSFPYEAKQCRVLPERNALRIGKNLFTEKGIRINLLQEQPGGKQVRITGRFVYGPFARLRYDIMGPFRLFPFLQCNHGVSSMFHRVKGSLNVNGRTANYDGGRGYLETDWGCSFPASYFWCQSSWEEQERGSVMVSVADIPLGCFSFRGCIAVAWYGGREYRFATYLGVRILRCTGREVVLRQGKYRLHIRVSTDGEREGRRLKAPENGSMDRVIRERLSCSLRCSLYRSGKLLFSHTGPGSAESVPAVEEAAEFPLKERSVCASRR